MGRSVQGLVEASCLTCCLDLDLVSAAFVRTLANFTSLHDPQAMRMQHAHALRQLLTIPDRIGAPCSAARSLPESCT
jgi:hypothetical protein